MDYQPKGSLCANCVDRAEDCSDIDFSTMPIHDIDENTAVVICQLFTNIRDNAVTKRKSK